MGWETVAAFQETARRGGMRMNPPSFSTFDPGRGLERAPLTRLRVSTRPVPGLGSDGRAHLRGALPDAAIWAVLLGVDASADQEA